jgi:parallel beta-helix repeat protein
VVTGGQDCVVSDLQVRGTSGSDTVTGIVLGNQGVVRGCYFGNIGTAMRGTNNGQFIGNQIVGSVGTFIDASAGFQDFLIAGNMNAGVIDLGASFGVGITGNRLTTSIIADGASHLTIDGNVGDAIGVENTALFELTDVTHAVISNNQAGDLGGFQLVNAVDCSVINIEGNTVEFPDIGIILDGCSFVNVQGNTLHEPGEHGISVVDSSNCHIGNNLVIEPGQDGANTFDGIILSGNSDTNSIQNNRIHSGATSARYGINISAGTCDNNLVDDNVYSGTFGTGVRNDAGTGTQGADFTI